MVGVLINELPEDDQENMLNSMIGEMIEAGWDKEVHQVLGNNVSDLINRHPHTCALDLPLPKAAKLLHNGKTQRLFVLNPEGMPVGVLTRGDVVRALAEAG